MAQPTQADQGTLKYAADGEPALGYFVGTPNTTGSLKFAAEGGPIYAPGEGGASVRPILVLIGL